MNHPAVPSPSPLSTPPPAPADAEPLRVSVVGAGLAGVLVALALARPGVAVSLLGRFEESATALSYGALLGRAGARAWRDLEHRHGPLGWQPTRVVLHGWPGPLNRLSPSWLGLATRAVPCSRLLVSTLAAALPGLLQANGVRCWPNRVLALEQQGRGWSLHLEPLATTAAAVSLEADQVVLAAGAGCRQLWPQLDPRLRCSWAGVLQLDSLPAAASPWLDPVRRGALVLPRRWQRPGLEAGAAALQRAAWIVDAGLVPWGTGALLGQISLVRPQPTPEPEPDRAWMEERLRQGLARLDPTLATLPGRYRQVPVPFCSGGLPLLGPVAGAPAGLWICSGFSAPFGSLPQQAEALATALLSPQA